MVSIFNNLLVQLGAEWVMYLMLLLSIISLSLILMRFLLIRAMERRGAAFWQFHVEASFQSNEEEINPEEAVLNYPCVETELLKLMKRDKVKDFEKGQLFVESFLGQKKLDLEKYLPFLATIGNNAPFLGLLGTVIGIIKAFFLMGSGDVGAQGIQGMSGAISEALVSTAVGLFVAIPAVIANNYLRSKIEAIMQRSRSLAQFILSRA